MSGLKSQVTDSASGANASVASYAWGQLILLALLITLIVGLARLLHIDDDSLDVALVPKGPLPDPSVQLWGRMVWTSAVTAFSLASAVFVYAAHRTMVDALDGRRLLRIWIEWGIAVCGVLLAVGSVQYPNVFTPRLLLDVENGLPAGLLPRVPTVIRVFDGVGLAIGLMLLTTCQCVLRGPRIRARDTDSLRLLSSDLQLLLYVGAGVLSLGVIASGVMHRWVGSEAHLAPSAASLLASAPMIALGASYSVVLLCTYALTALAVQSQAEALAALKSGSFLERQKFLQEAGLLINPWERLPRLGLALLPLLVSGPIPALLGIGRP